MRIRVGTLNAWALPEPLALDMTARIDAIGRKLADLDIDVMAFQEVYTSEARRSLSRAGRKAGLHHAWYHGDALDGGGLLVLSRLPFAGVQFERYSMRGAPKQVIRNGEYVSGKGFATIRFETPAGPFVLVDTHLHSRRAGASHRTGQIVQLAERFRGRKEPMVVVGDFNFVEGAPDYRVLSGLIGLRDAAVEVDRRAYTTVPTNPYRRSNGFYRRKDFIFVRDGAVAAARPKTVGLAFHEPLELNGHPAAYSNHHGVVAEIEIGPRDTELAAASPYPDPGVFELAHAMLAEGARDAERRRAGDQRLSQMGIGCAAVAGLAAVPRRVSRRRLLRMTLGATALAALTPGVGYSIVSEVFLPEEIAAFRDATERLTTMGAEDAESVPS